MKKETEATIDIMRVNHGTVKFCVLGTTPLILNRMSEKAMRELLAPRGKKTAVEKASSLKHDPYQEFKDSPYLDLDTDGETYLQHLSSAFKGSLKGAALDIPGTKKTQIGRLTWVNGERVGIYGVPKIFSAVTRSSDMNRTPDVRTRCIVPKWAAFVSVSYVKPMLNDTSIANLLASAGITQGVGDWRPEKGAGTYGQFELVSSDDKRFTELVKKGGRDAQVKAMENPEAYDRETEELIEWWSSEAKRRGFKVVG